ncbi:hypothetical protein [Paenibacillus sp. FSL L8-0709]|uniref:hypothetical protein n=1 Tax=Paenibacillus sp. FSL L8-0709 TaxID=2975312 RepID=UPI0030F6883A
MSNNYYFRNKKAYDKYLNIINLRDHHIEQILDFIASTLNDDEDVRKEMKEDLIEIANVPETYDLHIGQTSGSFKMLLHIQEEYQTVNEMEAYYQKNKKELEIVDESDCVLTWEELLLIIKAPGTDRSSLIDNEGNNWLDSDFI